MAIVVPIITTFDGKGITAAVTAVGKAETGLQSFQNKAALASQVGQTMTMGLTLPILAIGAASVKVAKEFDVSMRLIQTNTGATAKQMEAVEKAAIKMGQDTIYSANDAATAFLELTKAGLPIKDIMGEAGIESGALASAMNLAATEGMDLAYAAEIMSKAMSAYGIEAEDSQRITDVLAAAALASTASVTDLAYGLKYVASTAGTLNQPIEQTVTALALLNKNGLDASTAGTSLNQMLSSLVAPTDAAAKIMKEMGFSAYDASGELKPMEDLIYDLGKATEKMTGPEKAEAMRKLFNIRGARAANLLLKEGVDGWREMYGETTKAGVAADMANARMTGMNGALEQLRGSTETAALALGRALEPVIIQVAGWLQKLADWFSGLDEGTQQWIVKIGLLVAVIGPLIMIFGAMAAAVGAIITVFGMVSSTVLAVIAVIVAIGAAIWLFVINVKDAWNSIKAFFSTLDVGKFLRDDWERTKKFVSDAWLWIKAKASEIWTAIREFLIGDWNRTKQAAADAWNAVKSFFSELWASIKKIFSDAWATIKSTVSTAWTNIQASMKAESVALMEWLRGFPSRVVSAIGNLGRTLYNKGRELIQGFIDGIRSLASSAGRAISGIIPGGNFFGGFSSGGGSASLYTTGLYSGASVAASAAAPTVHITINESPDARTTAARVKRAIEGYDSGQGRDPGAPLRRTW